MRRNHARAAIGAAILGLGGALSALSTGCGGGGGAGTGGAGDTTVTHPDAPPLFGADACTVTEVMNIAETSATHLAPCTPIAYATNPPSGGDHWPVWAKFQAYTTPVPREMYVHDLEHGAIVLLYKCPDACPEIVAALAEVLGSITDPACSGGPAARMVLTPDPLLDTPIAAAAWGATYTATCVDVASLKAFAAAHYGKGPEDTCADGLDVSGGGVCSDAGGG